MFRAQPGSMPLTGQRFSCPFAAVRSRKKEDLNAEILDGHLSSALCHLPNISYRLGEMVAFSSQAQALSASKDMAEIRRLVRDALDPERIERLVELLEDNHGYRLYQSVSRLKEAL